MRAQGMRCFLTKKTMTKPVPFVVDLDGTLVLEETHRVLVRQALLNSVSGCVRGLGVLMGSGRSAFKHFCAEITYPYPSWTLREDLMHWLRAEKAVGRSLYLATGAPAAVARPVVESLDLFDDVWTSTRIHNLIGRSKAAFLVNKFGEKRFDYLGNSWQDCPVWLACRRAYLVTTSGSLQKWAKQNLPQSFVWHEGAFVPSRLSTLPGEGGAFGSA